MERKAVEPDQEKSLSGYKNYYNDYRDEKIKIYHLTVPDNNRLT